MEDNEISVERANMVRHFEFKKEVVLGLLKSIEVDKSPGLDGNYPRILSEAGEEIAGALTKIFVGALFLTLTVLGVAYCSLSIMGSRIPAQNAIFLTQISRPCNQQVCDPGSWTGLSDKELEDNLQNYNFRKTSNASSRDKRPRAYLLKDNVWPVNGYVENLRQKLAPLTEQLQLKVKIDTENLQQRVRQQLQQLRTKLSPYADGVHQRLSRNSGEDHPQLAPHTQDIGLKRKNKTKQLRKTAALWDKLEDQSKTQRTVIVPLTEAVYQKLGTERFDEGIQAILGRLLPDVDKGILQVVHQTGSIPTTYPNAEDMEAKIGENVKLLVPFTSGSAGIVPDNGTNKRLTHYMSDLKANLELVSKAFDENKDSFKINKVLTQKLINMKERLSPYQESIRLELQKHLANMSSYIRDEVENE
ncbi:uncharacterized protein LOC144489309 [Mustelus asterias]